MTGGDEEKWWRREVVTKGSDDEGVWWGRGVVRKGSGEEGEWWGRGVVRKGSGEEGKWTKGGGDEGKWWWRGVVRKGSGEEGKWTKGGGDDGTWWRWEVVRKGSGDEARWWRWEVVRKGSGDEGKWGGSRSTKPCVFPCKVAAGDDVKGTSCVRRLRLRSVCRFFLPQCNGGLKLLWVCLCVCVVIGCFGISGCRSHWNGCMTLVICCSGLVLCVDRCRFASWCCEPHCNGCMMLHGLCFGEEAGARNLVFFREKWLQATMKGTSCVRRLRLRSVCRSFLPQCNGGLKLLWVCLCVRSYRVFWNLRLQIALEWLHDSCRLLFWCCSARR